MQQGKQLLVTDPRYENTVKSLQSRILGPSDIMLPLPLSRIGPKPGVGLSPPLKAKWTLIQEWKYLGQKAEKALPQVTGSPSKLQSSLKQISQFNLIDSYSVFNLGVGDGRLNVVLEGPDASSLIYSLGSLEKNHCSSQCSHSCFS